MGFFDFEGGGFLFMELGVFIDVSLVRDEGFFRFCIDSLSEIDDSFLCDVGIVIGGGKVEGDKGRRRSFLVRFRIK